MEDSAKDPIDEVYKNETRLKSELEEQAEKHAKEVGNLKAGMDEMIKGQILTPQVFIDGQ